MKDAIIRNVQDIDDADRLALEHVLSRKLAKNQQVIIRIISLTSEDQASDGASPESRNLAALPDWCKVYEGLTDEQMTDLEKVVLQRANLIRP
jgi:hypothetical protein